MIPDIDNANRAGKVTTRSAPRGNTWGWLLLVVIACLGAAGSFTMSQWFRTDAREAWEAQAVQTEQFLSGTVLAWLEESYAPLSGVAVLFENSDVVTEDEFLDAVDGLSNEVKQKLRDVRPATLAQAGRIPGVTPAAVSLLLIYLKKRGALQRGDRQRKTA